MRPESITYKQLIEELSKFTPEQLEQPVFARTEEERIPLTGVMELTQEINDLFQASFVQDLPPVGSIILTLESYYDEEEEEVQAEIKG